MNPSVFGASPRRINIQAIEWTDEHGLVQLAIPIKLPDGQWMVGHTEDGGGWTIPNTVDHLREYAEEYLSDATRDDVLGVCTPSIDMAFAVAELAAELDATTMT